MRSDTKKTLIVATGNQHKLREIAEIFTDYEVLSQKQISSVANHLQKHPPPK